MNVLLYPLERAAPLAAAVAMLGVASFFFYEPARMALRDVSPAIGRHRVLMPLGALATVGAFVWHWFYGHPERVSTAFVRNVVRYNFSATVPRSGDDMYVSGQELYRFYRADPRLLEREAIPAPGRTP